MNPFTPLLRRRPQRWLVSAVTAVCLGTFAQTPATGRLPRIGDGNELALGQERRIGETVARDIYRDPDYLDDPILWDYVAGIWNQLRAAARTRGEITPELDERFAWEVMLLRDRSVNAFALPGGFMGLNLGLLAVVNSTDELASVMAHELSHVTQRHIARMFNQQERNAPWLIGAMLLGVLAASKSPEAANALIVGGQAAGMQAQLNFSRDMEREADRIGYGVMTQAGYEPRGFVGMFEKLQQASRLNDSGAYPYLRSHPLTTERMADMQARMQLLPAQTPPPPSLTHAMMVARARVLVNAKFDGLQSFQNEVAALTPEASLPRRVAVLYAAALAESRAGNHAVALQRVRALQPWVGAQVEIQAQTQVQLLLAQIQIQSGDMPLATQTLTRLRPSRAQRFLLAQARVAEQKPDVAQRVAEDMLLWLGDHPQDAHAWDMLSRALYVTGDGLRAVRAEAEARVFQYDEAGAIDRLRAAQDLARKLAREGRLDRAGHMEASIIDARLRALEQARREQLLQR